MYARRKVQLDPHAVPLTVTEISVCTEKKERLQEGPRAGKSERGDACTTS